MSADELAAAQAKADERMRDHWKAEDGMLVFDGHGDNLCTARDYGDFEMLVDWKIPPKGDSGIYLRGTPQVQIWETNSPGQFAPPDGSGGLYNDQKNNRHPLALCRSSRRRMEQVPHPDGGREGPCFPQRQMRGAGHDAGELLGA
jgi:hypothetical protein